MKAFDDRAGVCRVLKDGPGFFVSIQQTGGDMENQFDATYAAGICFHNFLDLYFHIVEVRPHRPGFNTHNGQHTGSEAGCQQISGGEPFTPAMIVNGGISFKGRIASKVRTGGS
jgi:hypothetical protein